MSEVLFMTQRKRILAAYKAQKQEFNASTKPYKSSAAFNWAVQNPITYGAVVNAVGFLVCLPQVVEFFSYKIGDPVPGFPTRVALEEDTNLSKARSTNGAEDFVIEGMSASCKGARVNYFGGVGSLAPFTVANVFGALTGNVSIYDPSSIFMPPQVQSPFNLEETMMQALVPHLAIEFEWDRRKIEKIGTLDQIPEGGAKSFLRASGDPKTDNRYRIPEGYLWRRDGQPACEFIVRATLAAPVVVPFTSVALDGGAVKALPVAVATDLVMRVHGLSVRIPDLN